VRRRRCQEVLPGKKDQKGGRGGQVKALARVETNLGSRVRRGGGNSILGWGRHDPRERTIRVLEG